MVLISRYQIQDKILSKRKRLCQNSGTTFFYNLQSCYLFFWLCRFFLIHLVTSYYIPVVSGYKQPNKYRFSKCNELLSCFSQFCTHLFDIKSYGKEGNVHCHLVFSHMPEPPVCHVVFHLSENSFRFYTPPSPSVLKLIKFKLANRIVICQRIRMQPYDTKHETSASKIIATDTILIREFGIRKNF